MRALDLQPAQRAPHTHPPSSSSQRAGGHSRVMSAQDGPAAAAAASPAASSVVLDQATINKVDRLEGLLARLERVASPGVTTAPVVRAVVSAPAQSPPPAFLSLSSGGDDSRSEVVEQLRVAGLVSPAGLVAHTPRSQRHAVAAAAVPAPAQPAAAGESAALLARIAALEAQNRALQATADALRANQSSHPRITPPQPNETGADSGTPHTDAAFLSPTIVIDSASALPGLQSQSHDEHDDLHHLHPSADDCASNHSDGEGGEGSPSPSPSLSLYAKRSTRTASVEIQLFEAHMAQGLQQQQQQKQQQQRQKRGPKELLRHEGSSSSSPPAAAAAAAGAGSLLDTSATPVAPSTSASAAVSTVASATVSPVLHTRTQLLRLEGGGPSPPTDVTPHDRPASSASSSCHSPVWSVSREPLDARGDPPPALRLQPGATTNEPRSGEACASAASASSDGVSVAPSWPAQSAASTGAPASAPSISSASSPSHPLICSSLPCPTARKKAPFRLLRADSRQCEYSNVGDGRISLGVRATNLVRLNWAPPPEPQPQNVLIIKKPGDAEVSQALYDVALWLHAHRKVVFVEPAVRVEECASIAGLPFLRTWSAASTAHLHTQIDLVVCLGGDGTLLWCSQLFPGAVPPVICFALGSLGFLSPFPLDSFAEALTKVFAGGFHLTLRSRLVCTIVRGGASLARSKRAAAASKRAEREAAAAAAAAQAAAASAAPRAGTGAGAGAAPSVPAISMPSGLSLPQLQRSASDPIISGSELAAAAEAELSGAPGSIAAVVASPSIASSPDSAYSPDSDRSLSPAPAPAPPRPRTSSHHAPPSLSAVRARHYSLSAQKPQGFSSVPTAYRSLPGQDGPGAEAARGAATAPHATGADDATVLAAMLSSPPHTHDSAAGVTVAASAAAATAAAVSQPAPPHSPAHLPRTATSSPVGGDYGGSDGDDDPEFDCPSLCDMSDVESFVCMNEVIIDRGMSAYLTQLDCAVDGMLFTRVQADGIICATPTGSTAYSLSAGGSIVHTDVPCVPVSDTRILTDRGFLFYDQLLALVSAGQTVLYACYDEASQQLVYQPGELIPAYQAASLLDFTQRGESHNWGPDADEYGRSHQQGEDRSNHLSIRCTPNHTMFVQMGNRRQKGAKVTWAKQLGGLRPPQRITAGELLLAGSSADDGASDSNDDDDDDGSAVEDEEEEAAALTSDAPSHVRFLAYAAGGVTCADESAVGSLLQRELGLQPAQVPAFLELYGFWLGDGGADLSRQRITFGQTKQSDRDWLHSTLPTLLPPEQWHSYKIKVGGRERFYTSSPLWWRFFQRHCGVCFLDSKQEQESIASTSDAASASAASPSDASASAAAAADNDDDAAVSSWRQAAAEWDESDSEAPSDEEDHVISPVKWFPPWVQSCCKEQLRAIVRGLRRADGVRNSGKEAEAVIYTSGILFRDALMHILLRAGYSTYFSSGAHAGSVCGYREVTGSLILRPDAYAQLSAEEQARYFAITARHDQWIVHWTDPTSGDPTTLGSGHPQMARAHIRQVGGEQVWCVKVAHKDNLVVMQRVGRALDGRVTKASRPIVIGNCMLFTPVCPHSLSFRPLLFPDTSTLQIKINADSRGTNCASFDGRHRVTLAPGDSVLISMSRWPLPSICRLDGTSDWFLATNSVLQWNSRSASQKSFNPAAAAAATGTATGTSVSSSSSPKRSASHVSPKVAPTPLHSSSHGRGGSGGSSGGGSGGHSHDAALDLSISAPHPLPPVSQLTDVREMDGEDSSASARGSATAGASQLHSVSAPPTRLTPA